MDALFYISGVAIILATLLPLVRKEAWWIRIFDFPRIQIAVIGVVVLLADLACVGDADGVRTGFHIVLAGSIFYQAYMIYPYTFLVPKSTKPAQKPRKESSITLLIANVKIENRNAAGLRSIVRANNPDVFLIAEANRWWENALKEFEQTYPFTIHQPQDNSYGMILYSRLEISRSEVLFRIHSDIPSIRACVTLPDGTQVEVHCLHPKPPVPQEDKSSKGRDAELLVVGREVREKTLPIIVMGDLNDVAWSHTNYLFQRISGLLDPRIGRGFYNTFDARYPIMRFPLDHFFHSNHFRLINLKRLAYFGSDHFPMYIALSYEPDAMHEQQAQQPSHGNEREASEKIESTGGGSSAPPS